MTVVRQLRDFAIAAALALLVATVAFVVVRNTELADRQVVAARHRISVTDGTGRPEVRSRTGGARP